MKTKVFVVDDHPLLRQGIAHLINNENDLEVVGEAEDPTTAMRLIAATAPEVAVLDISLKGASGIELLKQIREAFPEIKVLILSMHDESLFAQRALLAGARGYLTKDEAIDKALLAIRRVRDGYFYFCDGVAARINSAHASSHLSNDHSYKTAFA